MCLFAGVVSWMGLSMLVNLGVTAAAWRLSGRPGAYAEYAQRAGRFELWTGVLAAHAALAVLIPIAIGLVHYTSVVSPRWLISVERRVRWRFLAACFAVATVVFAAHVTLMVVFGPLTLHPQPQFWAFFAVIVLTSPIQALAEEVFFRGYVMQALGALSTSPWPSIVGSALIFAFFHGSQNLPLFVSRFVFGLLAAWLVVHTGGLEAGIAAHVMNNLFAFTLAGLTTGIAAARQMTERTWAGSFVDVIVFALIAGACALLARWWSVRRVTPA